MENVYLIVLIRFDWKRASWNRDISGNFDLDLAACHIVIQMIQLPLDLMPSPEATPSFTILQAKTATAFPTLIWD
ncbi:MAG: hypothetical protein A4E49_02154 [Methanosaeta sp. PtaU1.Bin112]|nr:MAG: hypothetical protein A4E49_02154 [Methanosaeta sp. PtaU1.Bin112]